MNQTGPDIGFFDAGGHALAYRLRPGSSPLILFLPGYASDMDGAKALALDSFAERRGRAMPRFDYSGTGASSGSFDDGTLAGWIEQAVAMVDGLTDGPMIVVGSSMGGWIALHLALMRPGRVQALVGIAAAPDFTDWGFTAGEKTALGRDGKLGRPSPYGGKPQLTTAAFWRSGQELRLLGAPIAIDCPVRLVHGDADSDVPVE